MNGGDTAAGIILLIIFLDGVIIGIIVIVSRAFVREDKHYSVKGVPPDNACSGARRLVGFSHRDGDRQLPPEGTVLQEWLGDRSGHGRRDER
jgi:hypothetical protein